MHRRRLVQPFGWDRRPRQRPGLTSSADAPDRLNDHLRRRSDYAGGRELSVLGTAAGERCDETSLARAERATSKPCHIQASLDFCRSTQTEAFKFTALDLLRDCIARQEGNSEAFSSCALDRLARVELPQPLRAYLRLSEGAFRGLPCARACFAYEQDLIGKRLSLDAPALDRQQARLRDPDDLVSQEGCELHPVIDLRFADERKLHAAGEQALDHLVRRGDLDFDVDVRMIAAKAAEGVREQINTWGCRGADVDRSRLQPGKRTKLFLTGVQRRECLTRPCGEQASRLGEAAAAAVSLDQSLTGSCLEQAQVLACGRLADSDAPRRGGDGALPLNLDEEAKPCGVPEQGERCIGHDDERYRKIRLVR